MYVFLNNIIQAEKTITIASTYNNQYVLSSIHHMSISNGLISIDFKYGTFALSYVYGYTNNNDAIELLSTIENVKFSQLSPNSNSKNQLVHVTVNMSNILGLRFYNSEFLLSEPEQTTDYILLSEPEQTTDYTLLSDIESIHYNETDLTSVIVSYNNGQTHQEFTNELPSFIQTTIMSH